MITRDEVYTVLYTYNISSWCQMTNWKVNTTVHIHSINEYTAECTVAFDHCEISFSSSLLNMFSWYTIGSPTRGWDMVSHTCAVLMTKTSKIFTVLGTGEARGGVAGVDLVAVSLLSCCCVRYSGYFSVTGTAMYVVSKYLFLVNI